MHPAFFPRLDIPSCSKQKNPAFKQQISLHSCYCFQLCPFPQWWSCYVNKRWFMLPEAEYMKHTADTRSDTSAYSRDRFKISVVCGLLKLCKWDILSVICHLYMIEFPFFLGNKHGFKIFVISKDVENFTGGFHHCKMEMKTGSGSWFYLLKHQARGITLVAYYSPPLDRLH